MKILEFMVIIAGVTLVLWGISSNSVAYMREDQKSNAPESITKWNDSITYASKKTEISFYLIQAIIMTESSGNQYANRRDGKFYSKGLMQITTPAARDVGYKGTEKGLYNPQRNILIGSKYLQWIFNQFNADSHKLNSRWERAVAAYNAGVSNIKKYGIINPEYVYKVKKYYLEYKGVY